MRKTDMGWIELIRKGSALYLAGVWALLLVGRLTGWPFRHVSDFLLFFIGGCALFTLWNVFGRKRPFA